MKLDFDLARGILLLMESKPANAHPYSVNVDGYDQDTVFEHLELLDEAGFIEANFVNSSTAPGRIYNVFVKRMTWKGHEFLDNARNDTVWSEAKSVVREKGGSFSLDLFSAVLAQVALKVLGLG